MNTGQRFLPLLLGPLVLALPNLAAADHSGILRQEPLCTLSGGAEAGMSAIAINSTRLYTGSQIYQARYAEDWSGELDAFAIQVNGQVSASPTWSAHALLPGHAVRKVFSYDGSAGFAFTGANLLTIQAQQGLPAGDPDLLTSADIDYLRGDATLEATTHRPRTQKLGDIINSDPFYVAKENYGYRNLPSAAGAAYDLFRSDGTGYSGYLTRPDMVFVGANDGMLHGFYATGANAGVEAFAYVPQTVVPKLKELTDPSYDHRFYVDGSAVVGDAYVNLDSNGDGSLDGLRWRTILVGTTGAGSHGVFALDVTDPENFGANQVLWELDNSDLPDLGYVLGQPSIVRLPSGSWAAVFGNGYNSGSNKAVLYVVDLATGSLIKAIDTQFTTASPNGLSTPVLVDSNRDLIADLAYAGDLMGNLWKFKLDTSSTAPWGVAYSSTGTPAPLLTVCDRSTGACYRQPITAKPAVGDHPDGGLMVYVGTGEFYDDGHLYTSHAGGVGPHRLDSFYGVWDQGSPITSRASLTQQTIIAEATVAGVGGASATEVRVTSATDPAAGDKGWVLDLELSNATSGERVISTAVLRDERIVFTTLLPHADCTQGSGWLMELDRLTGKRLAQSPLDVNGDRKMDDDDKVTVTIGSNTVKVAVSGKESKVGMIKTPTVISAGDREFKFTNGSTGEVETSTETASKNTRRQSWLQLK